MHHSPMADELSAEERAGVFSRVCFAWVAPFLLGAYKESLTGEFSLNSLPAFPASERPQDAIDGLAATLDEALQREAISSHVKSVERRQRVSLHRTIFNWKWTLLSKEAIRTVACAVLFTLPPLFLREVNQSMRGASSVVHGCLNVAAIALLGLVGGLLQQRSFHVFTHFGRQVWAALVGNMFKKIARLDSFAGLTEGQLLSMIGQDASIFPYTSPFFQIFMLMPFNIVLPSIVLCVYFREAF
eukprot:TRINITY_DN31853_c0_g1_i1.p1 TRINITY_DN31853_c0_g1~~TRINITY_DN31853_c0_g1_i1.p1  ORF type:complete len:243 (+),score=17.28 TRINITY_DN31853_c0_g1_i1:42-770(+)